MKMTTMTTTAIAALVAGAGMASAQEVRFMCYSDGNECEVYEDVLGRFEAENPGIDVVLSLIHI